MATIEERVSKLDIEKLAIIMNLTEEGKIKTDVMVKLVGEKHAYMTTYKVDRSLLDVSGDFDIGGTLLHQFFQEAQKNLVDVLKGKRELNAIV